MSSQVVTKTLLTDSISKEELLALLCGDRKPSIALNEAYTAGRLNGLPELLALRGVPQDPIWHPEGDCWVHTLWVTDEAWKLAKDKPYKKTLLLGALSHDFGKAVTTVRGEDERWRSHGHEEAGVPIAEKMLSRLGVDEKEKAIVLAITEFHMKPRQLYRELCVKVNNPRAYKNAIKRMIRDLPPDSTNIFLDACEADDRGRGILGVENTAPILWRERVREVLLQEDVFPPKDKKERVITGEDLVKLGFPTGKALGDLLRTIEAEITSGHIPDKEAALAFARKEFVRLNVSRV